MTITLLAVATFLAFQFVQLVYVVTQAFIGRCIGATVEAISVGTGPALWSRTIGGVDWRISAILTGGYTKFLGMYDDEELLDVNASADPRVPYGELPIAGRLLLMLSGPLSSIVIGLGVAAIPLASGADQLVVGPAADRPIEPRAVPELGISSMATTWDGQVRLFRDTFVKFWTHLAPKKGWGVFVGWLITCAAAGSISLPAWCTCFGLVCLGLGILNLLPIPVLNGGHIVFLLYEAVFGKPAERTIIRLTIPPMLLMFCVFVYLIFIDVRWCIDTFGATA